MPALRGKAKHVLMVTSTLARGGCERQMLATTTGLLRRGYTVAIFALAKASPGEPTFEAEFAALGVDMSCATGCDDMTAPGEMAADEYGLGRFMPLIGHFSVVRLGAAVGQAIRRFRPAVVHCWSEPATVIAGFPASALGVERFLLQLVNVSPIQRGAPEFSLYRDAYLLLLRNPDVVLLNISRTNARALEQMARGPRGHRQDPLQRVSARRHGHRQAAPDRRFPGADRAVAGAHRRRADALRPRERPRAVA